MLTGESVPAEKAAEPVAADAPLGDRSSHGLLGHAGRCGQGAGVVVATGAATEIGRISTLLGSVETLATPLLRQMDSFARQLTVVDPGRRRRDSSLFAVLVRGYPVGDMFVAVVGLAVAAIPEGLPAVLTVTLAIGVQRMARAQRRSSAACRRSRRSGSVSVICSDKTGTLTRNEMTVRAVATAGRLYEVTGVGYEPRGAFRAGGRRRRARRPSPSCTSSLRAALLCNDAQLRRAGDDGWVVEGDPMEGALRRRSR